LLAKLNDGIDFRQFALTQKAGGTRTRLYFSKLCEWRTWLPSHAEQKQIAECLRSADELLAAQVQKLVALKTHKQGLMQQLFPREGEAVPRLRFPEFQGAGEWDVAPLGTLLMSSPDYGVNAAAVPFSESLPKYLRITDISEEGRYLPAKQVSVDFQATDADYLNEGDIVLARTGASVGKSYQYRKQDGRLVFAGFLIRVRPDPNRLISSYLANILSTDRFWKWVAVVSARSGQPGINSAEYSLLEIPLPPALPEQQRISDCLATLDSLINAETQKLEALKTHKNGLMQQLFPSVEEVATT
jgi:type I restriction enzyme S subunit